jgi:hypothetical protein
MPLLKALLAWAVAFPALVLAIKLNPQSPGSSIVIRIVNRKKLMSYSVDSECRSPYSW